MSTCGTYLPLEGASGLDKEGDVAIVIRGTLAFTKAYRLNLLHVHDFSMLSTCTMCNCTCVDLLVYNLLIVFHFGTRIIMGGIFYFFIIHNL
jgi:hypothetical protein